LVLVWFVCFGWLGVGFVLVLVGLVGWLFVCFVVVCFWLTLKSVFDAGDDAGFT